MQPTNNEPIASGTGLFVSVEIPIQPAATTTPITAAKSSNSTTFTLGSCPLKTIRACRFSKYFLYSLTVFLHGHVDLTCTFPDWIQSNQPSRTFRHQRTAKNKISPEKVFDWMRVHQTGNAMVKRQSGAHTENANAWNQWGHIFHVGISVWMVRIRDLNKNMSLLMLYYWVQSKVLPEQICECQKLESAGWWCQPRNVCILRTYCEIQYTTTRTTWTSNSFHC